MDTHEHDVNDADAVYTRALKAGATLVAEPMDMVRSDWVAQVKDQCGTHWSRAMCKEDVVALELQKPAKAAMKQ